MTDKEKKENSKAPFIDKFVHGYPLKFFADGNNPFFISKEQGNRLRTILDNIINEIKRG